jgi:uncharacterized protein YkwD
MKKFLLVIALFVCVFSFGQSDSAWVAKFPPVPKCLKESLEKDSVWWMNYKMDTTKFRLAIMNEINKERKKLGKKPVTYGTVKQTNSVQSYTNYESENHFVGHNSDLWDEDVHGEVSAGNFTNVRDFIVEGDSIYQYIAQMLVKQWINSPGHHRTIIRDDWKNISVGICFRYVNTKTRNSMLIVSSVRGH